VIEGPAFIIYFARLILVSANLYGEMGSTLFSTALREFVIECVQRNLNLHQVSNGHNNKTTDSITQITDILFVVFLKLPILKKIFLI